MTMFIKSFKGLSNEELYQIMQLREKIFLFEQECSEEDLDGKDTKAFHIFLKRENRVVAYGRFFKPGDKYENALFFGRFAVAKEHRGQGLAQEIFQGFLEYAAEYYPGADIILSAQYYIRDFYKKYGFESVGEVYEEAGIDHIKLIKQADVSLTKVA